MKYLSAKKSCVLLFLEHSEADDGHDEQQDEAEDRSHNNLHDAHGVYKI